MGVPVADLEFLISARREGARFDKTLTVGRQEVTIPASRLANILLDAAMDSQVAQTTIREGGFTYLDQLLPLFGAIDVMSMDISRYEEASILHDLNNPVSDEYKNEFTVVYDGGSLEHVFNFPVALKSCMEMVKPGGHLILQKPANNLFGHGFYQLSPELFFRALSAGSGYQIERVVAVEDPSMQGIDSYCYDVTDPAEIKARVELVNSLPVTLLIQARRIRAAEIWPEWPQQSDYVPMWESSSKVAQPGLAAVSRRTPITASLTSPVKARLRDMDRPFTRSLLRHTARLWHLARRRKDKSFQNRTLFKPVELQRYREM